MTERKILEAEREQLIADLRKALEKIKTLKGLIPVCAWCKKVRDDKGTGKNSNITFANTQMLTSLMEYVRTV